MYREYSERSLAGLTKRKNQRIYLHMKSPKKGGSNADADF